MTEKKERRRDADFPPCETCTDGTAREGYRRCSVCLMDELEGMPSRAAKTALENLRQEAGDRRRDDEGESAR